MKILKAAVFVGLVLTIQAVLAQQQFPAAEYSRMAHPRMAKGHTRCGWPRRKGSLAFDADLAGGKYYLVDSLL